MTNQVKLTNLTPFHASTQKVLSGEGSNCDVFLVDGGGRIQIPLKAGHHRLASETPFKWRFAGVLVMAQH